MLRVDRHGPADAGVTVVLVHGAGGYGRMFAPLAAGLAAAGHEVLAPDLPGYGLSPAAWEHVDYGAWKRALLILIDAEQQRRARPIVLLGASIGGYLAYLVAAESPWVRGSWSPLWPIRVTGQCRLLWSANRGCASSCRC